MTDLNTDSNGVAAPLVPASPVKPLVVAPAVAVPGGAVAAASPAPDSQLVEPAVANTWQPVDLKLVGAETPFQIRCGSEELTVVLNGCGQLLDPETRHLFEGKPEEMILPVLPPVTL